MSRKEININSLEELVAFVLKEKYEAKERYSLEDDGQYDYQKKETVITSYYLYRSSGSTYSMFIFIPIELGKMIDGVWAKKPYYQGGKDLTRFGNLSLLGILKRLGKGEDTAKQLKAAEAVQKAQAEKNSRNHARKQIREAAEKLHDLLIKSTEINDELNIDAGRAFFQDLAHLTRIQDEE